MTDIANIVNSAPTEPAKTAGSPGVVQTGTKAITKERSSGKSFGEELAEGTPDLNKKVPSEVRESAKSDAMDLAESLAPQLVNPQTNLVVPTPEMKTPQLPQQEILDSSEVISFLTGKLDKVDPQKLGDLVSNNDFLQGALASSDLRGFLTQPIEVGQLIEQLELPDQLAFDVETAGVTLDSKMAPVDFLRAIGVDSQRVAAELKILRDTLPMDGISPYIERAKALQGPNPGPVAANPQEMPQAIPVKDPRTLGQPQIPSLEKMTQLNPRNMGTLQTADQQIATSPAMTQVAPEQMSAQQTVSIPNNIGTGSHEQVANLDIADQLVGLNKLNSNTPTMKSNTGDPISQLQARMGQVETSVQPQTRPQSAALTLEEQLIQVRSGLQPATTSINPSTNPIQAEQAQVVNLQQVATDKSIEQMVENPDVEVVEQATNTLGNSTKLKAPVLEAKEGVKSALAVPVDELQLDFNYEEESSGDFGSESRSFEESGKRFDLGEFRTGDAPSTRFESVLKSTLQPTQSMNTADRVAMVQKIMDQASMLVREGGGSVNMNLSNLNMGQLEVAMNVVNDQVTMMIMTESDLVKDLVSSDLNKLRDAFASSNMTLTQIDVGVGKDSQTNSGSQQNLSDMMNQDSRKDQEAMEEFAEMIASNVETITPPDNVRVLPNVRQTWYNQGGQLAVGA